MNTTDDKIQAWVNSSIHEGDSFYHKKHPGRKFTALGQDGAIMICTTVEPKPLDDRPTFKVLDPDIYKDAADWQGVNPFLPNNVRFSAFDLNNVLSILGFGRRTEGFNDENDKIDINHGKKGVEREIREVPRFNWDPYFVIDGKRVHYQRGFVWSIDQKQALISSIYRGLEIGRIIVHRKEYETQVKMYANGYTDYASFDIVDGKQRLRAIIGFCRNEFPDVHGNFYSDLSASAKRRFGNYQGLLYGEMSDKSTVEQICDAFLNNAVQGTPISQEHVDFMKSTREGLAK